MKLAAMPSPRGTNREKLFVLSGRRMAHDAAMPDPSDGDDPVEAVAAWARSELDTAGIQRLIAKLGEAAPATDDLGVPGKPGKPRNPAAMDSAQNDDFLRRFPGSARFR